jgi:hypothetical protein
MKLTITIAMDNAAFGETDDERADEVAVILYRMRRQIELADDVAGVLYRLRKQIETEGVYSAPVHDTNGNKVGEMVIEGEG